MTPPAEVEPSIACTVVWDAGPGLRELSLRLPAGSPVSAALHAARQQWADPYLDAGTLRVGVWGEECGPERGLREGDRVEIYRPLPSDPREARRRRVQAARRGR